MPASFRALVEWEVVSDVLVNLCKSESLFGGVLDAHCDQGRVGVWWADEFEKLCLVLERKPGEITRTIFRY